MSKRLQKLRGKWPDIRLSGLKGISQDIHPARIFSSVIEADPTPNHKYVDWTLKAWERGTLQWEDICDGGQSRIAEQLSRFETYKNRIPDNLAAMRSLMKYRSPGELDAAMDKIGAPRFSQDAFDISSHQEKKMLMTKARLESMETELPEGITARVPLTRFSSQILGRQTRWCTAGRDKNMFSTYRLNGILTIFTKGNRKFQGYVDANARDQGDMSEQVILFNENDARLNSDDLNFLGGGLDTIKDFMRKQIRLLHGDEEDRLMELENICRVHDGIPPEEPHHDGPVEAPSDTEISGKIRRRFEIEGRTREELNECMAALPKPQRRRRTPGDILAYVKDDATFRTMTSEMKLEDLILQHSSSDRGRYMEEALLNSPDVSFSVLAAASNPEGDDEIQEQRHKQAAFGLWAFSNSKEQTSAISRYDDEAVRRIFDVAMDVEKKYSVFILLGLSLFKMKYCEQTAQECLANAGPDLSPGHQFFLRTLIPGPIAHKHFWDDIDSIRGIRKMSDIQKIEQRNHNIFNGSLYFSPMSDEVMKRYGITPSKSVQHFLQQRAQGGHDKPSSRISQELRGIQDTIRAMAITDILYSCATFHQPGVSPAPYVTYLAMQGIDPRRLFPDIDYQQIIDASPNEDSTKEMIVILGEKGFLNVDGGVIDDYERMLYRNAANLNPYFAIEDIHVTLTQSYTDDQYYPVCRIEERLTAEAAALLVIPDMSLMTKLDILKRTPHHDWTPEDCKAFQDIVATGIQQRHDIREKIIQVWMTPDIPEVQVSPFLGGHLKHIPTPGGPTP